MVKDYEAIRKVDPRDFWIWLQKYLSPETLLRTGWERLHPGHSFTFRRTGSIKSGDYK